MVLSLDSGYTAGHSFVTTLSAFLCGYLSQLCGTVSRLSDVEGVPTVSLLLCEKLGAPSIHQVGGAF